MSNEARNRLRSMGGIMASSPELMQAAMPKYQQGGAVNASAGRATMLNGQMYLLMPDGGVIDARSGAPADPQTRRAVMQKLNVPPEVNAPREPAVGAVPSARLDGPLTFGSGAVSPRQFTPEVPFEPRVPAGIGGIGLPGRMDARVMSNILAGEDRTLNQQAVPSGPPEEVTVDALLTDSLSRGPRLEQGTAEQQEAFAQLTPEEQANVLEFGVPNVDVSRETTEEQMARAENRPPAPAPASAVDEEEAAGLAADVRRALADTAAAAAETDTTTLTDLDQNLPPPPPSGDNTPGARRTLRDRFDQRLALFKELYGEDDDARARDRAMSLAMLGLAIASGQSPNALSNIAEGAMVGLQGMSEQARARREQELGVRSAALESVIDEEAAGTAAEARAAEGEAERLNRLQVAMIRSAGGGESGSRSARNIIDFTQDAYNTALSAASSGTAADFDPEVETPQMYAERYSAAAREAFEPMYGDTVPAVPGSGAGETAAALPAPPGAQPRQRIRDNETGITYIVQDDLTMRPEG